MDIERWLRARGGVAHRETLLAAGCTPAELARCRVPRVRRFWLAMPDADPALRLAAEASADSDSLLETITLHGLRDLGLPVRQQVRLLGHRVDFLVGASLVIQTDGYEFHSDARQRAADLRHDAGLMLAGCRVLRFSYADIVHEWERTARIILAAVAQGLAA